jgi:GntR family transcriptional regulator, rspAB operon transcriptional repressor
MEASVRRRRPGRGAAYHLLRDAIISGELEPGRQLSENELATRLGVSRTPVREALVRLRDDRLVEIVPQLGTFVTPISDAAVSDAYFVREALECAAVREAANNAQKQDIAALRAILARQDDVRAAGDYARWFVLNDEFHRAICDLSGHPVAWTLICRISGHLDRIRRLSLPQPRYLDQMLGEHRLIVKAITRGDPDAAEDAMRHHLRMVLTALPILRENYPDYFATETD